MNTELMRKVHGASSELKNKKEILESIFGILTANNLLTLTTTKEDQPHSSSAYYVFDDLLNLYIWTDRNAHHSKNITKNPKISVNIADTSQKWGSSLKGLQIYANAKEVVGKELLIAGGLYLKRFPKVSKYVKKIKDFVSGELESVLFKLEVTWAKVLDEERFGKEKFKEIKINRA